MIAIGGLVLAWLVYDLACRLLGRDEWLLAIAVFAFVVLGAWGASQLFAARAAYIEVGAMLGTIMAANVFFVIIPAHWELVRAKQAGREPDPRWNARGKQRSVHNNYFTLPVVFAMLSNHFPFTYGHSHAWLILVVPDGDRRADAALLQPAPHGPERVVDPRGRRGRDRRARDLASPAQLDGRSHRARAGLRAGAGDRRQRCVPCHSLHPTQPGISPAAGGDRARHRRADRGCSPR